MINKWDRNDILKRVNSKVPHSLKWLPLNFVETGKQSYIDGSPESLVLCQFRLGRGQLENRTSSGLLKCTLCKENTDLTEAHVIMSCTALTELREECGIINWCHENNLINVKEDEKLKQYLGDDGTIGPMLKQRGKQLIRMRNKFLSKVQEQHERVMDSLNDIDLRLRANYDLNVPNPTYGQEHSIWDSWSNISGTS